MSFSDASSVLQRHQAIGGTKLEILPYTSPDDQPLDEKARQKVIVDGITDSIGADTLELYFENYKKSNGGEIENVEVVNSTTAVITFIEAEGKLKCEMSFTDLMTLFFSSQTYCVTLTSFLFQTSNSNRFDLV